MPRPLSPNFLLSHPSQHLFYVKYMMSVQILAVPSIVQALMARPTAKRRNQTNATENRTVRANVVAFHDKPVLYY